MLQPTKTVGILAGAAGILLLIVFLLPLDSMEYLSLNIVGEPPINGRTWLEGVQELGGEMSMRFLAAWGVVIMMLGAAALLKKEAKPTSRAPPSRVESLVYVAGIAAFFAVNLLIGYGWWDPGGFLGMGPLFVPSIVSLITFGLTPYLVKNRCKLDANAFATSRSGLGKSTAIVAVIAFGYGLVSCIWHCCSFFDPKMYFFFFVTKLVQLWAMCSYFFMWGLPMLDARFKSGPWPATITAVMFGICYPWHTVGFAITFAIFGLLLSIIARKTGSYVPGLALLYLAYIFHAGLPWHGEVFSMLALQPVSIVVVCLLVFLPIVTSHLRKEKENSINETPSESHPAARYANK
jgi:hypothetical protein